MGDHIKMSKLWVRIEGTRFVDRQGRHLILRGVNLGGDCKLPYPDGGTDRPSDFSDHRSVSFVGRPFPLAEADTHLGRIARWGFNTLRLLVTWEAVEHAGPGEHDAHYVDYVGQICERAAAHGLAVFIDFHQDAWSRMSGGSGAPGWTFEKLGIDFRRFDAAAAAHVMQYRYDYSNPERRQESRYPAMSWPVNYRMAANGIMWTAFFAGATLTPQWQVDGENVQHYLQRHYFGAVAAIAKRVASLPNVIGFDSLNEPGIGWVGQKMSQRPAPPPISDHSPLRLGPMWTPFDGLRAARGLTTKVPFYSRAADGSIAVHEVEYNSSRTSIWLSDGPDPFEQAGAWRAGETAAQVVDEDFFIKNAGQRIDHERDFMQPFFHRMAAAIRSHNPDWLLFAEINPHLIAQGRSFPKDMPPATINASHWYDLALLWSKRSPSTPNAAHQTEKRKLYGLQLAYFRTIGERLNGGAPTLIGEFGVPFDLNDGESFHRWSAGERNSAVWQAQALALQSVYDTLDTLLLSSTQWNYTASNRNDLRVGDGWNQEDLSIFSCDQQPGDDDGGRAVAGFCRPYLQRAQGRILQVHYSQDEGVFRFSIDLDPEIEGDTEIFIPARFARTAPSIALSGAAVQQQHSPDRQLLKLRAAAAGIVEGVLHCR